MLAEPQVNFGLLCERFPMLPDSILVLVLVLDNVMDIVLKYELI